MSFKRWCSGVWVPRMARSGTGTADRWVPPSLPHLTSPLLSSSYLTSPLLTLSLLPSSLLFLPYLSSSLLFFPSLCFFLFNSPLIASPLLSFLFLFFHEFLLSSTLLLLTYIDGHVNGLLIWVCTFLVCVMGRNMKKWEERKQGIKIWKNEREK